MNNNDLMQWKDEILEAIRDRERMEEENSKLKAEIHALRGGGGLPTGVNAVLIDLFGSYWKRELERSKVEAAIRKHLCS